jgi:hypothetical protein
MIQMWLDCGTVPAEADRVKATKHTTADELGTRIPLSPTIGVDPPRQAGWRFEDYMWAAAQCSTIEKIKGTSESEDLEGLRRDGGISQPVGFSVFSRGMCGMEKTSERANFRQVQCRE